MKILFVGAYTADYQCDSAFHGFRSLFGPDVVDPFRMEHMYKGCNKDGMYGRGFTLFGLIEEGQVDREDIDAKIRTRYFDLVVFGSARRSQAYQYAGKVWDAYPPEKIVFIDGEDDPDVWVDLSKRGILFKRELHKFLPDVHPIQFGFPSEKIQTILPKTHVMAPLDPIDLRTYVYESEQEYYDSYRRALFGKTMKKAGWECMRHLEIMACHSIPYFVGLDLCPESIMTRSPKAEMLIAKSILEYNQGELYETSAGQRIWEALKEKIFAQFKEKLTTTALATYVLDKVCQEVRGEAQLVG
jgi:hypothetical protein